LLHRRFVGFLELVMKIALTSVFVNSPIEAFKFYTEKLRFLEKMYMPEANLAIVVSPEDPDGTALLLEPNDNPIAKTYQEAVYQAGLPLIIFGVDDIDREYERLKKLGVVFRGEPTKTEYGTQAVFEDTCGNLIQLHQA
jgi:predicted enzyme related to lactoylglutathione lyase